MVKIEIPQAELLERLFFARTDAYAMQNPDGVGYQKIDSPVNPDLIQMHLDGLLTLGAYQLNKDNKVLWIAFDFDSDGTPANDAQVLHDSQVLLSVILETEYKCSVLLEDTGNGVRRHIWVFFQEPVSAGYARALAKGFLEDIRIVAEVFPKQTAVTPDGYGNLVKVPLGINRKTGNRSILISPDALEKIRPFHVSNDVIEEVELEARLRKQRFSSMMKRRARYCIYDITNNPVDENGNDRFSKRRNITGHALARALRSEAPSISSDMVYGAMMVWNISLQKQLPNWELEALVRGAYERDYPFGCSTIRDNPITADFCKPERCPWGLKFLSGIEAAKWLVNFGIDQVREWDKKVDESLAGEVISITDMSDKGVEVVVLDKDTSKAWKIQLWNSNTTFNDDLELFKSFKFQAVYLGKKMVIVSLVVE